VQFEVPESRTATLGRLLSGRSGRLTAHCTITGVGLVASGLLTSLERGIVSPARRVATTSAGAVKPRNHLRYVLKAPIGATHFTPHHLCRPYRGLAELGASNRGCKAPARVVSALLGLFSQQNHHSMVGLNMLKALAS